MLTTPIQPTLAGLSRESARTRKLTDWPMGMDLMFLPVVNKPDYPDHQRAIIDGVRLVETAGNNPGQWIDMQRAARCMARAWLLRRGGPIARRVARTRFNEQSVF